MNLDEDSVYCRGCLRTINKGEVRFNVFGTWISPCSNLESIIGEDLSTLAHITIKDTDKYSKFLCKKCYCSLCDALQFISIVRTSHVNLTTEQPKENNSLIWPKPIQLDETVTCFKNDSELDIKQEIMTNDEIADEGCNPELAMEIKIEPEEFSEPLNNIQITVNGTISMDEMNTQDANGLEVYEDEEYIDGSLKNEPSSEEDESVSDLPLECLLCAKNFTRHSGLKAHVIANHSYKSVKRKSNKPSSSKKRKTIYKCVTCLRKFETSTDLMVHETCHNKAVCYGCSAKFNTFPDLIYHRKRCKAVKEPVKPKTLQDVVRHLPSGMQNKSNEKDSNKSLFCSEQFSEAPYLKADKEIQHVKDMGKDEMESAMESIFGLKRIGNKDSDKIEEQMDSEKSVRLNQHIQEGADIDFSIANANVKCIGNKNNKDSELELRNEVVDFCISNTNIERRNCRDFETLELENMLAGESQSCVENAENDSILGV